MATIFRIVSVPLILFLTACTISLAPPGDKAFVAELNQANQQTLTLFSALEGGGARDSYSKYSKRYDEVIGAFGALETKARARPVPALGQKLITKIARRGRVAEICAAKGDDATGCVFATPDIIVEIIEDLTKLRELHQKGSLKPAVAGALKGDYVISIQQVLVLETALLRE